MVETQLTETKWQMVFTYVQMWATDNKCQVQMLATDNTNDNNKAISNICYNDDYYQKKIMEQNLISFNLPPNWKNRYDKQVLGWFWIFGIFFYEFSNKFYLKTYSIFNWNIDSFYDDDEIEIDVDDDEFEL